MGQEMTVKGKAVYRAVALAFAGVIGMGAVGPVPLAVAGKRPALQVIPANPDDAFVELRNAARRNDVARSWELADSLSDYPIQSYVQYFRIKPQLFDASGYARTDAPEDEIRSFLQRYKGEAIADRLRNDWLLVLGKKRDWATFDAEYPQFVLKDDTQVECYALLSRAMKGQNVAADARNTLSDPKGYGEGCVDLIGYLAQSGQLARADVAFAARLSLEQNLITQAARIAAVLPEGDRVDNDTLANVTRMARSDPSQATAYLMAQSGGLSKEEQGAGWGVIGQYAAKKQTPDALDAYRRQMTLGGDAWLSDDSQEWRVRTALRAGDWKMVAPGHRFDARAAAQPRSGLDLLVRPCAQGRRPQRGREAAVPVDRRAVQLLWPVGAGRARPAHHRAAAHGRDRCRDRPDGPQPSGLRPRQAAV